MMRRHRRRLGGTLLAGLLAAAAASAQGPVPTPPEQLMTGVTLQHEVELTPHGPVAYSVITAPPPTGLYGIGPVLGEGTIGGPRETVSQLEESVDANGDVAGVDGDFFNASTGNPVGIVVSGGRLEHAPTPARVSIGFDASGALRVDRIAFAGTWQGSGQRHPLVGVNQKPKANQAVLFTPAWGTAIPAVPNAAYVLLEPFPAATINADLTATVASVPDAPPAIPADGAVLVATGGAAAKLQAEAAAGGSVTVRLILPDAWGGVVSALGGGPLLVKGGKPVFSTSENFKPSDLTRRDARAAVGQLANGDVILVAVDGGRPGYSVGMTSYELAQTMARLGAVTAAGLEFGKFVTAAFDGRLLDRPSDPGGERPVKEALLVSYQGVYAPPPAVPVIGAGNAAAGEQLSYRLVRPSNVTAAVIGPDGTSHVVDSGQRQPGTYSFTWSTFDLEGTWHWNVQATDDLGRRSTADETFQYDLTLGGLSVPKSVSATAGLHVAFTLSRPASVTLRIAAANGTLVTALPAVQLAAGAGSVAWDGTTAGGAPAPSGRYVAEVTETSSVGTVTTGAAFTFHR
jgi:Phosphodiester glycosidase/FlgD Ig-like domain